MKISNVYLNKQMPPHPLHSILSPLPLFCGIITADLVFQHATLLPLPWLYPYLQLLHSFSFPLIHQPQFCFEVPLWSPWKVTHVDCNLFLGIYIIKILKILLNPLHFIFSLAQTPISILYSAATLHLSSFQTVHLISLCSDLTSLFSL